MPVIPATEEHPAFIDLSEEDKKQIAEFPDDYFIKAAFAPKIPDEVIQQLRLDIDELHHHRLGASAMSGVYEGKIIGGGIPEDLEKWKLTKVVHEQRRDLFDRIVMNVRKVLEALECLK
jgi:hypothetical protein